MALKPASMPRFEQRVLLGSLLCALPGVMVLVLMALFGTPGTLQIWGLVVLVVIGTALLARWQFRRIMFPLYTLAGLLEALREGDYSLRGVQGGALGDVVYDINALADRLQKERLEFEESSHLLGKTLAALDSAVFVFDDASRLRLLNPAGQRLLDAARSQLFGRSAEELGLATLLQGPSSVLLTHAFPGQQGRFDVRHAALRSNGRGGTLLVINDVGRVLREEERQAWQRLLRVLGHEVNNSLAPIQSMAGTLASLMARDALPADWREDFRGGLDVIAHRAAALTRFLSSYSKLARLPPPQRRDVELAGLIEKTARLEQRLPVRIESGEDLHVHADTDQLEQALINLLRNAVEAMLPGAGTVTIRWTRDGEHAVIDVEDEGVGLPPSDNLFVPFFTTKPGGSGIGLALVRQIAEAHDGGVMLVARETGIGARARLWLPLASEAH
ncbi:sensor histidine kinase [Dyella nitratireducens]|nr:ATP-binding protein [Dyella nitratireducens]